MKYIIAYFFYSFLSVFSYSQSISSIFRILPDDCTPELNNRERDTLLKRGEYIIPGGDSLETVKYSIDSNSSKKHLRYEYSFTTGQNSFILFEIRMFKKNNGNSFIVFSRYGGMLRAFDQQSLRFFNIQNGKLIETKAKILPKTIQLNRFLKLHTPGPIKRKLQSYISSHYELSSESGNSIEFQIFNQVIDDEIEKYLNGHAFRFRWTGDKFIGTLIKD